MKYYDDKAVSILMIMYGKSVGGAELQFIELANYLANTHKVCLVSLGGDGALRSVEVDPKINIRVVSYNGPLQMIRALSAAIIDNTFYEAKHVVTTSFIANLIGWASSIFRARTLLSLQTVSKCMRHPVIDRFVLKRFDVLVAGAKDIKEYLISHGQESRKIEVVHNWVDFSKRAPSLSTFDIRKRLGVDNKTVIGCIGRFHPQKGQIHLIRAFSEIIKAYENSVLLLVGDGETRQDLENEVLRLDLTDHVIFTGTAVGLDYNNLLSVIDIYVQPSIFEGLPRTLLDAMYTGKPIVATDINGNKEAITDKENGLLVRSASVSELKEAIIYLIHDRNMQNMLSKNASLTVRSQFSMDVQLQKIEHFIVG